MAHMAWQYRFILINKELHNKSSLEIRHMLTLNLIIINILLIFSFLIKKVILLGLHLISFAHVLCLILPNLLKFFPKLHLN